jgi:hypothetical protein
VWVRIPPGIRKISKAPMVKLAKASGLEPEDRKCSRFESGWGYMNIGELKMGSEVKVHDIFDGVPYAMPCIKIAPRPSAPRLVRLLGVGLPPNGRPVEYGLPPEIGVIGQGHVFPLVRRPW